MGCRARLRCGWGTWVAGQGCAAGGGPGLQRWSALQHGQHHRDSRGPLPWTAAAGKVWLCGQASLHHARAISHPAARTPWHYVPQGGGPGGKSPGGKPGEGGGGEDEDAPPEDIEEEEDDVPEDDDYYQVRCSDPSREVHGALARCLCRRS